jgi:hypothetical protein
MKIALVHFVRSVLLAVVLLAVYVFVADRGMGYQPPRWAGSLAKLAAASTPRHKLAAIEVRGQRYYIWIGLTNGAVFASGPPVCAFDSAGGLIGRCIDVDETVGGHALRRYRALGELGRGITFQEALDEIGRAKKSPDSATDEV